MYTELVGLKGGCNDTYWEIVAVSAPTSEKYYPAIKDGLRKTIFDFENLHEYLAHKEERRRVAVTLTVLGNPISAEDKIAEITGKTCLAIGPSVLKIYLAEDSPNRE